MSLRECKRNHLNASLSSLTVIVSEPDQGLMIGSMSKTAGNLIPLNDTSKVIRSFKPSVVSIQGLNDVNQWGQPSQRATPSKDESGLPEMYLVQASRESFTYLIAQDRPLELTNFSKSS